MGGGQIGVEVTDRCGKTHIVGKRSQIGGWRSQMGGGQIGGWRSQMGGQIGGWRSQIGRGHR